MKRYILVLENETEQLKKNYLNYKYYFSTIDEAISAAEKITNETQQRVWLLRTVDYIKHINTGTEANILCCL